MKYLIVNIIKALIYNIENIFNRRLIAALITANIKGIFNIILVNKLIL